MAQTKDKEQIKRAKKKAKSSSGEVLHSATDWSNRVIQNFWETSLARNKTGLLISLFIIVFSLYCLVAILSFIYSGADDFSLLQQNLQAGDIPQGEQVFSNVASEWGASLANFLVNGLIGLAILFPLYFIFRLALSLAIPRLLEFRGRRLLKSICSLTTATLFTSIGFAWLQRGVFAESNWCSHLRLGGVVGENMLTFCLSHIGAVGTILLLLFLLTIILVVSSTQEQLDSLRHKSESSLEDEEDLEDEEEIEGVQTRGFKRVFSAFGGLLQLLFSYKSYSTKDVQSEQLELDDEDNDIGDSVASIEEETPPPPQEIQREIQPQGRVTPPMPTPIVQGSASISTSGLTIEHAPEDDLINPEEVTSVSSLPIGMQLGDFKLPPIDLLEDYGQGQEEHDSAEIEQNMQTIITTLREFKKQVLPHKVTIGPTVTLYEIIPEAGVMVSSIRNLAEDISRALKSDRSVRIIAPMPSTGTVGIEVPNSNPQIVSMRSLITSRRFNELKERMELPIAIGKTITNEPFIFDLSKSPHLLIAGATGQGKSVGLNALITSLLYSKRPEELKLVMIDPKMVEFSIYEHLSNHYLAAIPGSTKAIITEMDKVVPTLNSLCIEMDNRLQFIAQYNVRGVKDYNEAVRSGKLRRIDGHEIIPSIVLIIDEYADLVMTAGKEVEQPITRLGQKARAAGIHVVIATQRPTVNVITGLIKANFPARIAFKVVQAKDSQTILDTTGANSLIGRGDMLYVNGGEPQRLQCAFVDTPECEAIVSYIQSQESFGHPHQLPEALPEGEASVKTFNPNEKDPLFDEVARMIVSTQVGSTSNIQRKYNIGYNRAGRLMDQLEGAGIVGAQEGSKPREVYIQDQDALDHLLSQLR